MKDKPNRFVRAFFCALILISWPPLSKAQEYLLDDSAYTTLLFGDIDYRESDGIGDDGFQIGQLVGQLNVELDSKLSVFTELTAGAKINDGFEFEVERLFVRYDFSDMFKLSAGRFHTPIGYWNTAFHHGAWLQTTISRPETFKFGSNVIPIHFVGALLEGKLFQSDFGYRIGFGNGRCEQINQPCDLGDDNGEAGYLGQIYYRPLNAVMLDTGLSVYVDTATPEFGPETDEVILNAYVAFQGEQPELIAEYTHARHERTDTIGPEGDTNSVYVQLAYRLWGKAENWKPYIRAESLDVDNDDPLLGDLGLDYEGIIGGVRWDFSRYAALKAEVRSEDFYGRSRETSFWIQLAFVFDPRARGAEIRNSQHHQASAVNFR